MPIIPILSILNGLPVARIEVLLLPVASLVRLPDPTRMVKNLKRFEKAWFPVS